MMPNLLFLTQRIPYPPTKGEKIRAFHILDHLRRSYNIYLGCLVDDNDDIEHVPTVRELCADAYFAMLDRRRAKLTCLRALFTGEPLSVAFYRDRGLTAWVRRVIREVSPEIVFICSSNVAPYILDLHGRERVRLVDLVDVDSEKWRSYSRNVAWPMRSIYRREWHRLAKIEARIVRECDWSTLVSAAEARLFARLHPTEAHKIYGISNGVDHVFFDPSLPFDPPFATDCANFVFTGTMDYLPNVDAAAWFVEDILPIIRRCAPNAKFHIVGSNPSPTVQALTATQGVFVTGRVADVRPYIAHASAAVAPMRVARGIQNKVLEAMAMGKPVVVTGGGLEGIDAIPGVEVLVAETPEVFAAACLRGASGECAAIGSAARHRVLRDYIWSERLRSFDRLLAEPPVIAGNGRGIV